MKALFFVDGYNIIFAWDSLKTLAHRSLEHARQRLIDMMAAYGKIKGVELVLVFDAMHNDEAAKEEQIGKECTVIYMITTLSGGNQQKAIIGKWLAADARLLIFDEPTRGIDVGAKNEIYQIMRDLANEGKGILMVSSELPELLSVCDRIVVFGGGKIKAVFDAREATEEKIMLAAT